MKDIDQKHIWHPFTQMKTAREAIFISRGKDALLYDEKDEAYIDGISSWWVTLHGHANSYIAEKVSEQLTTLEQVIFADFTHGPAIKLVEALLKIVPSNQQRFFFSDDGSTSVEVSIKMAIQYWYNLGEARKTIVAFNHAYHGDTFGSMSLSARSPFNAPFNPFLFDVVYIDPPSPGNEELSLEALNQILAKHDVAALVYEPLVQGAGGMIMSKPKALETLLKRCKEEGVLLVADEVMVGFGRTGKHFASLYMDTLPDIMCMSKGLTGGTMALAITSCTETIYNAFLSEDKMKTFFHGHSFTANPVACTAALASTTLLLQDEAQENIRRIEGMHSAFAKRLETTDNAQNVRQQGTIIAFDVKTEESTSYFNNLKEEIYRFFLDRKILLRPLGNTVYILPPYCTGNEQLEEIYSCIELMLKRLQTGEGLK